MLLPVQQTAWNKRCGADFLFFRQWFLDFKLWPASSCNFNIWAFSKTESETPVSPPFLFLWLSSYMGIVYYLWLLLLKSPSDCDPSQSQSMTEPSIFFLTSIYLSEWYAMCLQMQNWLSCSRSVNVLKEFGDKYGSESLSLHLQQ